MSDNSRMPVDRREALLVIGGSAAMAAGVTPPPATVWPAPGTVTLSFAVAATTPGGVPAAPNTPVG